MREFNRAYLAVFGGPPWDGEDFCDFHDLLDHAAERAGGRLTIRWRHSQKSMAELGHTAMAEFWRQSLTRIPTGVFSPASYELFCGWKRERLHEASAADGSTLFEWLLFQIRHDGEEVVDLIFE